MQRSILAIILGILLSLILSTTLPLLTYSCTLALFGAAHVFSELRYIDQRFGERIKRSFAMILGILLLGILCTRSAMVFKLVSSDGAYSRLTQKF